MAPGSTGPVVNRPSALVTISVEPAQMDAPRSGEPVAASSTRPAIARASPRGAGGAAGAGVCAAGFGAGVAGDVASGVAGASVASVSGVG